MKKINYFLLIFLINSFYGVLSDEKKVLKNEKISSTDEFLVKKREPLTLPPNYEEIPKPGTTPKENEEEEIKKILKVPKSKNAQKSRFSTTEESILDKIRK